MITDNGQAQLLKQVAGKANRFADLFVVGISDATLTTAATALDFSWGTATIVGTYVDKDLQQVVFYGTLSSDLAGDIKEIGLISLNDDFIKTGLPNAIVYSFDANENWFSDAAFTISNNSSIGTGNYRFEDAVVDQYLAKLLDGVNVSRYDTLKLKITSTDVTQVRVLLKNDEINYAWKDITLVDGDNLSTHNLSSFTTEGSFNPLNVTEVRYVVKVVDSSTNSVEFDAMTLFSNVNGGLVARHVPTTPVFKRTGATMEIEIAVAM